jgi:hypothetical protein
MSPAKVRAAVYARAGARCECGCERFMNGAKGRDLYAVESRELDHMLGRAKAGWTVETCWALRRACHRAKTENRPGARSWLVKFIAHCQRYGYAAAADLAQAKLDWADAKAGAA